MSPIAASLDDLAARLGWPSTRGALCCEHCRAVLNKRPADIKRAADRGLKLYCSRACAGAARRFAPGVKAAMKAEYDRQRRAALGETLRAAKRAAYYERHAANLARAAEFRRRPERIAYHNEYCRQPAYVAQKVEYDRRRRARLHFADFSDSFLLLQDLEREIETRATRYEVYMANGTINKAQTRKRALA